MKTERVKKIGAAVLSIGAFVLVWYLGTRPGTELGRILPGPGPVLEAFVRGFYDPIGSDTIPRHIAWSLMRVLVGFVAAAFVGILLGLLMGRYRIWEAICMPLFNIIRPIPPIAWISLSILWFGIGELTKYFLIFLAAFNNITYNVYAGAKSVDPVLIGAARMLGASDRQVFATVIVPATVPDIFAGLQVALSTSWATVVAAEMVRASEGAGWIIVNAMEANDTTQMLVGIIAIGLVGFILVTLMRVLERRLCAWNYSGK